MTELERLFQRLTRHQLYVEGVKRGLDLESDGWLTRFRRELRELFNRLRVSRLSDLTPKDFRAFVGKLNKLMQTNLGDFAQTSFAEFRRFLAVDMRLTAHTLANVTGGTRELPDVAEVWNEARTAIVPATGRTLKETVQDFVDNSANRLRTATNTAYVDKLAVSEATALIAGTEKASYIDGALGAIGNAASAMVHTAVQHVSSVVSDVVGGLFYSRYQWQSVIDTGTTPICRERDGKVYTYGEGPRPPAHYRCRSKIMPIPDEAEEKKPPSLIKWAATEAREVIRDIFRDADEIAVRNVKPITVDEYAKKLDRINREG